MPGVACSARSSPAPRHRARSPVPPAPTGRAQRGSRTCDRRSHSRTSDRTRAQVFRHEVVDTRQAIQGDVHIVVTRVKLDHGALAPIEGNLAIREVGVIADHPHALAHAAHPTFSRVSRTPCVRAMASARSCARPGVAYFEASARSAVKVVLCRSALSTKYSPVAKQSTQLISVTIARIVLCPFNVYII